jgi:hypothetical protein
MSEPISAFVKLRIDRPKLVQWLDAPVALASRWTDWRDMGGQYYSGGDDKDLKDFSNVEMAAKIAECDGILRRCRDNRFALKSVLRTAEAPQYKRASYRTETRDFMAGSLTYAENLINFVVFYAIVRGVEEFFAPDDYGVAVLHDFVWGEPEEHVTHSAVRLGPGARSGFMHADEMASASGAFQAIADEMLSQDSKPPEIDELDSLK